MEGRDVLVKPLDGRAARIAAEGQVDRRKGQVMAVAEFPVCRRVGHAAAAVADAVSVDSRRTGPVRVGRIRRGVGVHAQRTAVAADGPDSPIEGLRRHARLAVVLMGDGRRIDGDAVCRGLYAVGIFRRGVEDFYFVMVGVGHGDPVVYGIEQGLPSALIVRRQGHRL